jgi:putative FmdB family regulatory protein
MAVYDYRCESCGPFTATRPMAECDAPHACPACGKDADRAWITAPRLGMSARSSQLASAECCAEAPGMSSHGGGCACCSGASMRFGKSGQNATSGF